MKDKARKFLTTELIALAGEMARCDGMPRLYRDDWRDLPSTLSQKAWKEIRHSSERAHTRSKEWASRLIKLAEQVSEDTLAMTEIRSYNQFIGIVNGENQCTSE